MPHITVLKKVRLNSAMTILLRYIWHSNDISHATNKLAVKLARCDTIPGPGQMPTSRRKPEASRHD
jgi:hypothetical protein